MALHLYLEYSKRPFTCCPQPYRNIYIYIYIEGLLNSISDELHIYFFFPLLLVLAGAEPFDTTLVAREVDAEAGEPFALTVSSCLFCEKVSNFVQGNNTNV